MGASNPAPPAWRFFGASSAPLSRFFDPVFVAGMMGRHFSSEMIRTAPGHR
jgi:hypothetical protein